LKTIYHDRIGRDPAELVRIWDDGIWYYVIRNDDTQAVIPVRFLAENREAEIVEALRQFKPLD
jgi:hypothetical protein